MKQQFQSHIHPRWWAVFILILGCQLSRIFAEGSADFINQPGYRLHLVGLPHQQFKVFARAGEFINVGSSNLEHGGTIRVFKPNGVLARVFDIDNLYNGFVASIDSLDEEIAGPIGKSRGGYNPGVVSVGAGETGVWTVVFTCSSSSTMFPNLLNNEKWRREEHQTLSMTIIAWDVTVSKNAPANVLGAQLLKGRLYSQELSTFLRNGDISSSPRYFVLTRDGFLYRVQLNNLSPVRFWFSSNNVGIVRGDTKEPHYKSILEKDYSISSDLPNWHPDSLYYYDPQEADTSIFVNNKVFFNPPANDLPANGITTNVFKNNTHLTWLLRTPTSLNVQLGGFSLGGSNGTDTCFAGSLQAGVGGYFHFYSNQPGVAEILLDINNNGSFLDPIDREVFGIAREGNNSVFWDGADGYGNALPVGTHDIPYRLNIRAGGMHILYRDVENSGGFSFTLLNNNLGVTDFNSYFFDHSEIGGGVSGGGAPGNPLPQTAPDPYTDFFGDEKLMNYWKYYGLTGSLESVLQVVIKDNCAGETPDSDGDGIADDIDVDDDNDGIPDIWEYCNPSGGFACLPNGKDPSGDEDRDGTLNFKDANDPSYPNPCIDANNDGMCDNLPAIFDTDGDGVPDHLDLDSDNDGITDLFEAEHGMADADGNGVIDGVPADFGSNGFFDGLESNPNQPNWSPNYSRSDVDADGTPDHDDLDSDGDGIWDVMEAGLPDPDFDGWVGTGIPSVDVHGLPTTGVTSTPTDTDGDGVPDFRDLDSDNDFIPDADECPAGTPCRDLDGDGAPDFQDIDRDGDGIDDNWECETSTPCVDTDGDGTPDIDDSDSDNDGLPDSVECANNGPCPDSDGDGIPDFRDFDCTPIVPGGIPSLENLAGMGTFCAGENSILSGQNTLDSIQGPIFFQFLNGNGSAVASGFLTNVTDAATLTLPSLTTAQSGNYTLILTGKNGCSSPPAVFQVEVAPTPPIATLSAIQNRVCEGSAATLIASGSFVPGVEFEWFQNGNFLTKTTSPELILSDFTNSNIGNYHVVAKSGNCSAPLSNVVALTLTPRPQNLVASNSLSGGVCEGTPATLHLPNIPNATFAWTGPNGFSSNQQNPTIAALTVANAGTYHAQVIIDGCAFDATPTVLQVNPNPATPVLTSDKTNHCAGSDVELEVNGVTGAASYQWWLNGNQVAITFVPILSLQDFSAQQAGTYSVVAVGNNNCLSVPSNSLNIQITDPVVPIVAGNSLSGAVCEGGAATLTLPSIAGANYLWSGPSGFNSNLQNPTISPLTVANAGMYSATVTLGNCSFPAVPTSLIINANPATPVLTTDKIAPCLGGSAILQTTPSAGSVTYHWFFNGSPLATTTVPSLLLQNFSANEVGNYSVIVDGGTCQSGISNILELKITAPNVPLVASNTSSGSLCEGESVTLQLPDVPGATYLWVGPNAYTSNIQNPTIVSVSLLNSGVYNALVRLNGCDFPASPTSIQVNPLPSLPILSVSTAQPCAGTTATLTATTITGAQYEWYFDSGAGFQLLQTTAAPNLPLTNFSISKNGKYQVVAVLNNCKSSNSNIVEIKMVDAPANLTASNSIGGSACEGSAVTFSLPNIAGASYQWSGPAGFTSNMQNPTISALALANSGSYAATITVDGCTFLSTSTEIVVKSNPEAVQLTNNSPVCENVSAVITVSNPPSGNTIFSWLDGQGNLMGQGTDIQFELKPPVAAGNYFVQVERDGCSSPVSPATVVLVDKIPTEKATVVEDVVINCATGSAFIEAVAPIEGIGMWSPISIGVSVLQPSQPKTVALLLSLAEHQVVWSLSKGTCFNYSSDTVRIISESSITAIDDKFLIPEGGSLQGADLTANDILTGVPNWKLTLTTPAKYGEALLVANRLQYLPKPYFVGIDYLTYKICSENCPITCSSAEVIIQVGDDFFIPNIITPNDDGKNDGLVVPGLERFPNNRLSIYNRWGDIILDQSPYKNDWRGTWQGKDLPAGTYFIVLYPDASDGNRVYSQYLTIVR